MLPHEPMFPQVQVVASAECSSWRTPGFAGWGRWPLTREAFRSRSASGAIAGDGGAVPRQGSSAPARGPAPSRPDLPRQEGLDSAPPAPRGRRRPDPLAAVTTELRAWFDEDQSQTGRELLTRLQNLHPDVYPDGLLRTVQRRLRIWRAEVARQLVFGPDDRAPVDGP